jgi:methionyl aminopeptidase
MVNAGTAGVKVLSDGWTAVTRDRSLSAHFEHTVVVVSDGAEILTLLPEDEARARQLRTGRWVEPGGQAEAAGAAHT